MERLTIRNSDGSVSQPTGLNWAAALERLAAYEDTGLEPCETNEKYATIMAFNRLRLKISLARLCEILQAETEERCVVLPCKLHDKIYYVDKGQVRETEVESIHNWTSGRWKLSTHTDRQYIHWIGYEIDFEGIGTVAFLTREEAEAALREAEG